MREVEPQDCHARKVHAVDRAGRDLGRIAVGIGDQRVLAAELERPSFEGARRARAIALPVGTEPISATFATRGCSTSAWPHSRPPVSTSRTPGGNSGPDQFSQTQRRERAWSGGLMMSELPAASGAGGAGCREQERMVERV